MLILEVNNVQSYPFDATAPVTSCCIPFLHIFFLTVAQAGLQYQYKDVIGSDMTMWFKLKEFIASFLEC